MQLSLKQINESQKQEEEVFKFYTASKSFNLYEYITTDNAVTLVYIWLFAELRC
jgi:hypothetical protein